MKIGFFASSCLVSLALVSFNIAAETTPSTNPKNEITSISTSTPAVPPPWAISLKSEWSRNLEEAKTVGGASTDNQFRIEYKLNSTAQMGLLFGGKYTMASEKQNQSDQKMIGSDTAIVGAYVIPNALGADKVQIDGRYYLPTSDASRDKKQNGLLRADIKMPFSLENQKSFKLYLSPRHYNYQNNDNVIDLRSQVRFDQGKNFLPYVAFNHTLKLSDIPAGYTRMVETAGPEIGIETQPNKFVNLNLRLAQDRNILNPSKTKSQKQYSVFDPDESTYYLEAVVKL